MLTVLEFGHKCFDSYVRNYLYRVCSFKQVLAQNNVFDGSHKNTSSDADDVFKGVKNQSIKSPPAIERDINVSQASACDDVFTLQSSVQYWSRRYTVCVSLSLSYSFSIGPADLLAPFHMCLNAYLLASCPLSHSYLSLSLSYSPSYLADTHLGHNTITGGKFGLKKTHSALYC